MVPTQQESCLMFLALAEIRRAKGRFALLIGAVGLLAYLILFQQSLTGGLITQFIGGIRNQSAPVLVLSNTARSNIQASLMTPEQLSKIRSVDGVAQVERFGVATFTASTKVTRRRGDVKLRQIDASMFGYELGKLGAPLTLSSGRLAKKDGEAVASKLNEVDGFKVGETVTLEPNGGQIMVVGVAKDVSFLATPTLFVSFNTFASAKLVLNPNAKGVLPNAALVSPVKGLSPALLVKRLNQKVAGVEALTRKQAEEKAPGVAQVQSSFGLIIGLLWFVVLLSTGLFFLILTVQKTGSLTVLRAMGASSWKLVGALIIQVILVLSLGLVLAVVLFLATLPAVANLGLQLDPSLIATTAALLFVLALFGTALGATRRVVKIDPASATHPLGGLR
jgi:putative ABC transport system permease protein